MPLIDDIKAHYVEESHPPDGPDLDYDFVDGSWKKRESGEETKQVSYEVIDDSPRWGDVIQAVYRRGDELVAIQDIRPATEMQDWGDYGDPKIYAVEAVETVVIEYKKVG